MARPASAGSRLHRLRAWVVHAFALEPAAEGFTEEERALLEKVARLVVGRRMAAPARIFLESLGPLNFIGSQALHYFSPIVGMVCDATEMDRLAAILERRTSIPVLIRLIEAEEARRCK
ncbi:MAG: hypothetical protein HYV08_09530 [Deltaproteobacteria bacterium]|nr:hypothetical protein [Deltaproteobacteria bacterium]MBI3077515.1 hypothetical protein [Deltaproteobacteria bacterium]